MKVSTADSAGAMAGGPRPRAQFVKVSVARALTRTADFAAVLPLYFIFYLYEFSFFAVVSFSIFDGYEVFHLTFIFAFYGCSAPASINIAEDCW